MSRLSRAVFGFGIAAVYSAWGGATAPAQTPGPADEAKLHELAKKEGTLVWYSSMPLEPAKDIAKDFEAKYPGVKVEVLRIVGVAQYQRFMQETNARQYIADIVYISDYPSMKSVVQQGHVVEWKVPASDRVSAAFRIGDFAYSPDPTDIAIVYNVHKVTPEEVKVLRSGWRGVLDPRFKGRFAVTSMKCGTCYAGVHMFLDPKNAKVFGLDFIKAVGAQSPTVYSEILVGLDRVVAGEHDFTFWTWEKAAYVKWAQGAPIRWIHPEPTPEWGNSWYGVSKYAPHPNAARLFLNWITAEGGAAALQKHYGAKTVLQGFKDGRKATAEPWYDPIKTRYEVDWDRWAKNYHKDMDLWTQTMMRGR